MGAHAATSVTAWTWDDAAGRPMRRLSVGRPSEAPDVVVIPGLGACGYLRPLVDACAAWTRVHLLDVPGFGDRRTAHCPATVADVASLPPVGGHGGGSARSRTPWRRAFAVDELR